MAKSLNALDLDELVASTMSNGDEVISAMQLDSQDAEVDKKSLVDEKTGATVDFTYIYNKLSEMIDNANDALKLIQAIQPDPSDLSTVTAVTSMMNVIKGCIAEFTHLHSQHIRFENQIKLENLRYQNKLKFLEEKKKFKSESQNENPAGNISVNSADLIEFLQWKKQKEQEKEEKNNRI